MKKNSRRLLVILLEVIVCGAIVVAVWLHQEIPETVNETITTLDYSFGISMGDILPALPQSELDKRLDDLVYLRVGWIRIDMGWDEIQSIDSETYDWSRIDRVVAAANARHIKVLPILAYTPKWARSSGCHSSKCAPADPTDFASFAKVAVARYASQGIHTWEIWNEQNLTGFWKPYPSVEKYAELLRVAHSAIHEVDSTAIIITGGLGPIQTGENGIAPIEFLSGLYDAGASDTFDAVGDHPYSYPTFPSHYKEGNAWSQMAETNPSLRSVMIAHGDESKAIWLTEFGVPTGGPNGMSETSQSEILTDALKLVRGYAWDGPLFLYSYQDIGTSQRTSENFFGILRYDGTKKSAYGTLKAELSIDAMNERNLR